MLNENQPLPDPSPVSEGRVLVAPDTRTQAALLICRARGDQSLAELARALQTLLALGATDGESPPLPDPASTGKAAAALGKRLVLALT